MLLGTVEAADAKEAIEKAPEKFKPYGGKLLAVPHRSWGPTSRDFYLQRVRQVLGPNPPSGALSGLSACGSSRAANAIS